MVVNLALLVSVVAAGSRFSYEPVTNLKFNKEGKLKILQVSSCSLFICIGTRTGGLDEVKNLDAYMYP